MTVRDIFEFLNKKFPADTAADFDNVGILVGNPEATVTKAVVSLDCTPSAINTAKEAGAELIITHHPIIFNPLKNVVKGSPVFELIENSIAVISMHTNLDIGVGGVNDCLSATLTLKNVEKVIAEDGFTINKGELITPLYTDELAEYISERLGAAVKYLSNDKVIEKVLICSGSGGSYLAEAQKFGCDALITADVKHNMFIESDFLGIPIFDAGHFDTENVVINPLTELLRDEFKYIEFITDKNSNIKTVLPLENGEF